jgi:hypothetical protein
MESNGFTQAAAPRESPPTSRVAAPWEVPNEDLATQRYLRLHYDGPEGEGVLRLILRLATPSRFSLEGRDRLGREWFTLLVDQQQALFLDDRQRTYCWFHEVIEIAAVPLGPLPFEVLPALLLHRLPADPSAPFSERDGEVEIVDRRGRRWTALLAAGQPVRWTLWRGPRPYVTWRLEGEMAYLSSSEESLQLRWQQRAGQLLAVEPAQLEVPDGYSAAADCR